MKLRLCILFSILLLVGCSPPPAQQVEEKAETPPQEKPKESKEVVELKQGNFKEYRPKVGEKRTYTNSGEEIYVHEIVAENEEYVQVIVSLSGAPTTQIYRWTNDEYALVHEAAGRQSPELIEAFVPMEFPEIFIDLEDGQAEWQVIDENLTITVPKGTFEKVIAIQKTTDEVAGADTIYTRYFAPAMGLVKETYEVIGEHGYKDEANLDKVE
ncbi:hypothetical protein IM538_21760 [Cytobacillus suaedae]|nr:hypothetical protein IM538_21760 [Cytobacillus suaedae]